MLISKISRILILFCLLIGITSCAYKKKVIYFQGNLPTETRNSYTPTLRSDDLISITVLGMDEIATKPFNLPLNNYNQNVGGYTQGAPTPPGYLIDSEGNIEFPVIGKLKLAGLNRNDAVKLIKEQLKPYLANPTVLIRILNFKVTVLGEVKNPGTFSIPNERITLPEAIGIAGDLQITAVRKNVLVIREEEGKKVEHRVDLTQKDLFSSVVYYLQQNDVIYIEPNRAKINSAIINPSNVSLVISIISLFITMGILFTR